MLNHKIISEAATKLLFTPRMEQVVRHLSKPLNQVKNLMFDKRKIRFCFRDRIYVRNAVLNHIIWFG